MPWFISETNTTTSFFFGGGGSVKACIIVTNYGLHAYTSVWQAWACGWKLFGAGTFHALRSTQPTCETCSSLYTPFWIAQRFGRNELCLRMFCEEDGECLLNSSSLLKRGIQDGCERWISHLLLYYTQSFPKPFWFCPSWQVWVLGAVQRWHGRCQDLLWAHRWAVWLHRSAAD